MSITTVYSRAVSFPPVLSKYSVLRPCTVGSLSLVPRPDAASATISSRPSVGARDTRTFHGLEPFLNLQQKFRQGVNCSVSAGRQILVYLYCTQPSNITGSSSSTMRISHVLAEQGFLTANSYPHAPDPASQQPYGGKGTKTNKLNIPTALQPPT